MISVRDAVARLPNGEGNRADICELLKDSQFLAPGITDAQVNKEINCLNIELFTCVYGIIFQFCFKFNIPSSSYVYLCISTSCMKFSYKT